MSDVQVKLEAVWSEFKQGMTSAKQHLAGVMQGMKDELKDMSEAAKLDSKNYESTFEQMGNVVQGHFKGINGAIAGVKAAWAQLAVVIGAGLAIKAAVDETVQWVTESQKLARTLGITTNAASALNLAIGDVYGTTEEYIAAAKGLDRSLKKDEEALQALGIATRDSSGELRNQQDILLDSLDVLRSYKEGTDRNLAAVTIFGKGVDMSSEMLALNAEKIAAASRKAEEMNLVVGEQSVDATNAYRAALNDAQDVIAGLKVSIGNELMPVMTELCTLFAEVGPTAIMATRIALNILIALFRGLALVVKSVWEVVTFAFRSMADYAGTFGDVFSKVMSGDFAGAQAAAQSFNAKLKAGAMDAFGKVIDMAAEAGSATTDAFMNIVDGKQGTSGGAGQGKGFVDEGEEDKKSKAADAAARAAAQAAKQAAAEAHRVAVEAYQARMAILKGEEEAQKGHWDAILAIQKEKLAETIKLYGENSREAQAMRNQILATERAAAAESARIEALKLENSRNMAMAEIAMEEEMAGHRYSMGLLTNEQMLTLQMEFEARRYEIRMQALQQELLLQEQEPIKRQEILNAMEELERQHQLNLQQIKNDAQAAAGGGADAVFKSMETSFAGAIQGMLTKTMTFRQALASIWKSVFGTFVQEMIAKPLAQWAMRIARELIMHKMLNIQKNVVEKGAAVSNITKSAAQAGAAGTASFAAAPWPINIGAPAFGAAMSAAAMGFMAGASAEKGYDIPAGVNPVTQLHQKEMVLPAAQANVIRDLANGRGLMQTVRDTMDKVLTPISDAGQEKGGYGVPNGANPVHQLERKEMALPAAQADVMRDIASANNSGGTINLSVQAMDSRGVRDFLRDNIRELGDALRTGRRDFAFGETR